MTTSADRPVVPGVTPPEGPAGGTSRRAWLVAGAVLTALLVVLAAVLVGGDGGRDTAVSPPASSAPSVAPSAGPTTEPTTRPTTDPSSRASTPPSAAPSAAPTVPADVDRSTAVWPVAGASVRPDTPVAAARGFATELGFRSPVVGPFAQGDSRSGEVAVRPTTTGPVTTVLVRQLSGERTWSVLGATTEGIEVTEPAPSALVRSPLALRGSALAFEGHVDVQVREDGRTAPLGETSVTGGGDVARPFTGTVAFSTPTRAYGSLVLLTRSAKDGSVWQASVQRLRLAAGSRSAQPAACAAARPARPALPAGSMEVAVTFTCDPGGTATGTPFEVVRAVPESPRVLAAALTALLAGPTPQEREAGLTSWFSSATAGMLRGVTLTDGRAVVDLRDLRPVVPGASSAAGSAQLLSQLDATVLQFPTVSSVEYRIDGSCTAFTEWLQLGGCTPRTRS